MRYFTDKLSATFPIAAPYIKRLEGDGVGATLVRGAGGAFIVNVIGTGLMFATHVVLARTMGAASYGNFAYAVTWLNILVLFGKLGLDTASLRFIAEYNGTEKWGLMKGFVQRSSQISLAASVVVALTTAAVIWTVRDKIEIELATALWVACLILPLQSLLVVRSASLRGLKKVVKAQSAQRIVRPAILIMAVAAVYLVPRGALNATTAMAMNLAAFAGALLFVAFFLKKELPQNVRQVKSEYKTGMWFRVALPMLLLSFMAQGQSNIDIIFIGFVLDPQSVGIYSISKKIVGIMIFGLQAIGFIAAPLIAEYYHKNQILLQRILQISVVCATLYVILVFIIFVVSFDYLVLLIGNEYSKSFLPFLILAVGQIVNSSIGLVGLLLTMTAYQKHAAFIMALAFISNLLLLLIMVPKFGIAGAAFSMSVSTVLWNLLMYVYVKRYMYIESSILSLFWKK